MRDLNTYTIELNGYVLLFEAYDQDVDHVVDLFEKLTAAQVISQEIQQELECFYPNACFNVVRLALGTSSARH